MQCSSAAQGYNALHPNLLGSMCAAGKCMDSMERVAQLRNVTHAQLCLYNTCSKAQLSLQWWPVDGRITVSRTFVTATLMW